MRWLLAAAVLGCGCGMSADECRREAAALQAFLLAADTGPALVHVDPGVQLVTRADLPDVLLRAAPVITVGERDTTFQGQPISDPAELRERLAAVHARTVEDLERGKGPRREPPDPALVYLLIDARARWPRVVEVWQAARDAELQAPAFVFGMPGTVTPPPRAPIDDKLDELQHGDGASKATELAKVTSQEIKGCPALVRSFGNVAYEASGSKSELLVRGMGPALVDCKCNVSIPNLRSIMWRILANPNPIRVHRTDPTAPPSTISLPATATWADAAPRFGADVRHAALAITE